MSILNLMGFSLKACKSVSRSLVYGDMMGHHTHGVLLLAWYLEELEKGNITVEGEPTLSSSAPTIRMWEGHRLPGSYVLDVAIDDALEVAQGTGAVVTTIANTFHNGALVTYLPRIADRNMMAILASSGPGARGVVPHGSTEPIYTPNPISAVIPTEGTPTLIDISSSVTTMNRVRQNAEQGEPLSGDAAISSQGIPITSARDVMNGLGALLPLGGIANGHKGFAIGLLVEALTQSLTGNGRQTFPEESTVNSFLLVLSLEHFSGYDAFTAASTYIADQCRAATPLDPDNPVRIPGDRAMESFYNAKRNGVHIPYRALRYVHNIERKLGLPGLLV